MSTITEIDWTTTPPTVSERPMTEEELAQVEKDKADEIAAEKARKAEEAAKAARKAELLAKLGITEDDAKLLLS